MTLGTLAVDILAQEPTGPEFGKASPLGLALILILLLATVALIWNMNKQLSKLPDTFEPENPEPDQAVDDGTDRGAVPGQAPTKLGGDDEAPEPKAQEPKTT